MKFQIYLKDDHEFQLLLLNLKWGKSLSRGENSVNEVFAIQTWGPATRRKPGMAIAYTHKAGTEKTETQDPWGFPASWSSSIDEFWVQWEALSQKILWRETEEGTQCRPLASTETRTYNYIQTCIYTQINSRVIYDCLPSRNYFYQS